MYSHNMVLQNSIPRRKIEIISLCLHKSCQSESTSSTDWMKHYVPTQNTEAATIEFPGGENKVHGHK